MFDDTWHIPCVHRHSSPDFLNEIQINDKFILYHWLYLGYQKRMAQLHLQPGFWYSLSLCCFYCKKENFINNTKQRQSIKEWTKHNPIKEEGQEPSYNIILPKKKIPLVGKTQLSQIMGFGKKKKKKLKCVLYQPIYSTI